MQFRAMAVGEDANATFRDRVQRLIEASGFSLYLVCSYPSCGIAMLNQNVFATNWPTSLLQSYAQTDIRSEQTFFGHFRESTRILRGLKLIAGPETGFVWTVGFTLFTAARHQYVFVISAREAPNEDAIGKIVLHSIEHLAAFQAAVPHVPELSQRETDCLYWAAAGKSSEDIGAILSLSSHTVNDYLKSAMRKLQSINRTQAVAKATRLGII